MRERRATASSVARLAVGLVAILAVALAGCASEADRPTAAPASPSTTCDGVEEPTVRTPPEVPALAEDGSGGLGLHVSTSYRWPVDLVVRFDARTALDAAMPGITRGCLVEPVYRYAFERPGGSIEVTASAGGRTTTATIRADAGRRWVVVQLQPGFPVALSVHRTEPQWG